METHLLSFLLLMSPLTRGFNLDTAHPRTFSSPEDGSAFGHRVCPFGSKPEDSVLVTDPLYANGTGGLYRCSYGSGRCEPVRVDVESGSSFGLSLACSDHRAMVCGPHLVQKCEGFNYLNGVCKEFSPTLGEPQTLRPAFQACHVILPLDAVILFDDSNSIKDEDFTKMINFIKEIIKAFIKDKRAQLGVAKFSTDPSAIFQFENFAANKDPEKLMSGVTHAKGQTNTPSAIRFVLDRMFQEDMGMRVSSQKLLVVITDGKSNENKPLDDVILEAEKRKITRFAIGVGKEYSREELEQISSSQDLVFETESFSALNSILHLLTKKIFAIEGTNLGSSIQLELSQGGFSVALAQEVSVFGAVGAYSWAGGLEEKRPLLNASFINASNLPEDMTDSYLGYSVAVATVEGRQVYFAGAPRHKHTGLVLGFSRNHGNSNWTVTHRAHGSQLGSYFGAEVCVLNGLLAVGAPLYHAVGVGGEVTIFTLSTAFLNTSTVLRGAVGSTFGRFGSALSTLQDLNGDSLLELVVGAPQEEDGKGALYIFLSYPGGIRAKFSQRVFGGSVNTGRHFGVSLHSAVDLSSDGLPDLVVGSRGNVTVFRTNPVVCVNVSVTLDPPIISQDYFHCSAPYGLNMPVAMVNVCVKMKVVSMGTIKGSPSANVSVILEIESGPRPRLLFSPKSRTSVFHSVISSGTVCSTHSITLQRCISNYSDVALSGTLKIEGRALDGTNGLKPVQNPDCPNTFTHMVLLEKVCGEDHVCVSDLQISLRISRDMVVNVKGFLVNLSAVVLNNGEDATDTELRFYHPSILSYTRVTELGSSGRTWCTSNETRLNVTHTVCKLGVTIFRHKAKVALDLSFRVSEPFTPGVRMTVNATVTSKNEKPETLQDNSAALSVPVKERVSFQLENGGSTQYDQNTLLNHTFNLVNKGMLSIPLRVSFLLPVEMSSEFLWDVSAPNVNDSRAKCEKPLKLKKEQSQNSMQCNASSCLLIGCNVSQLTIDEPISFQFSGSIQSLLKESGVQVSVMSRGCLSFDEKRYTNDEALEFTITTEVDFPSPDQTLLIASLSVTFGVLAMAVLFYVLYKQAAPPGGEEANLPDNLETAETTPPQTEAGNNDSGQTPVL
ncbi:integrin alpha-M-like isoform X2 [Hoplias malabaricus]|uniref:integrin alpha-M-like isoform X2 n=1 Tax=Hoplias malabaricus TaxID=27720 RepID=UPI0034626236